MCRVAQLGSKLTSCVVSSGAVAVEHDVGLRGMGRVAQSGDSVEQDAGPRGIGRVAQSRDSVEQDAGPRGIGRVAQSSWLLSELRVDDVDEVSECVCSALMLVSSAAN